MADNDLRELLFGDVPTAQWAGSSDGAPWSFFAAAALSLEGGDRAEAERELREVLAMPGLESRHYLQAWDGLRGLGVQPSDEEAKHLYGVVLDVPVDGGRDTLAAYEDGSCRYLNHSGRTLIWDVPGTDPEIDSLVTELFAVCRLVVERIGPWEGPRPLLADGQARLSFLCPGGLHFGQATLETLQSDPMASAVFGAGAQLLQALIDRSAD